MIKGIDVSSWQGSINWEKVNSEIDFAILRAGYGSDLAKQDDKTFKANADACTKLGIPFGVYLYSYADNVEKAKSEAKHILRVIKGYKLTYPVYYDLEDANTTGKCSNAKILQMAKAFAEIIEGAGYTVGFYANKYWWTTKLTDSWYNGYSRWVAQYYDKCTYTGKYDIWQYTSSGKVSGINGNVDMNYCYKEFEAKKEPVAKPETKPAPFAVGDKVKITGAYAISAYSEEALYDKAKGKTAYIVKIYNGTKFPYQLGAKKGDASSANTTGFANASSITKATSVTNATSVTSATTATIPAKGELAVGDKVKITGAYASSAYDSKAGYTRAKGSTAYVTKIYKGTNFPYQLGAKKGDTSSNNTIGFAKASAVTEI